MSYPFSRRLRYRLEILGGGLFLLPLRALPLHWASGMLAGLLGVIGPKTGKSRRIRHNLALALPSLTDKEKAQIEKAVWRHIGHFLAEFIHLPTIYKQRAKRIELVNPEIARNAWQQGKGMVAIGAHLGAWELLIIAIHMLGIEGATVYRPANNPTLNTWMVRRRTRWTGFSQIPKYGTGMRGMIAMLRDKKTIGILADQRLSEGIEVPFFGQPAKTSHIPIKLARRYGSPLLYASITRLARGRFRVQFHESHLVPHTDNEDADIRIGVQSMNDQLEKQIRADPGNWLWTHNRWRL